MLARALVCRWARKQSDALAEVGGIGPGRDKAEQIAKGIAGHMDFGGGTGLGSAHRLG